MQGHNALFVGNCMKYLEDVVIDNVSWFRRVTNYGQIALLSLAKAGQFDLMASGLGPRRATFQVAAANPVGDTGISAYWCPFESGDGLPGWVDLPLLNPTHKFMFTASMQGCALVVTESPNPRHIRLYHHQHPEMSHRSGPSVWNALHSSGQPVLSMLDFDEYGTTGLNGNAPNAFNFLYYRNATWNYVTQAHILLNAVGPNGATIEVNRRPVHGTNGVSIRSLR